MSRIIGPAGGDTPLAAERKRALEAVASLGDAGATGPVVFRRMQGQAGHGPAVGDQSLLYPALHGLEADGEVRAAWTSDADGARHRVYRRRRFLSRLFGSSQTR